MQLELCNTCVQKSLKIVTGAHCGSHRQADGLRATTARRLVLVFLAWTQSRSRAACAVVS